MHDYIASVRKWILHRSNACRGPVTQRRLNALAEISLRSEFISEAEKDIRLLTIEIDSNVRIVKRKMRYLEKHGFDKWPRPDRFKKQKYNKKAVS